MNARFAVDFWAYLYLVSHDFDHLGKDLYAFVVGPSGSLTLRSCYVIRAGPIPGTTPLSEISCGSKKKVALIELRQHGKIADDLKSLITHSVRSKT